ncbi:MAG: hypothetical protein Q9205_003473 [Flavoplaca limonia]
MSNGALNQPTSSNRPFSSVFDSFPNFSMPHLPTFRFTGDGLDYRRPTPNVPLPNNQDVIDLTEDHSPEVQRQPRPSNRTNPRNFIDIDEENTTVNFDDASESPDLELLEVVGTGCGSTPKDIEAITTMRQHVDFITYSTPTTQIPAARCSSCTKAQTLYYRVTLILLPKGFKWAILQTDSNRIHSPHMKPLRPHAKVSQDHRRRMTTLFVQIVRKN